jgi:hypothetical protein
MPHNPKMHTFSSFHFLDKENKKLNFILLPFNLNLKSQVHINFKKL